MGLLTPAPVLKAKILGTPRACAFIKCRLPAEPVPITSIDSGRLHCIARILGATGGCCNDFNEDSPRKLQQYAFRMYRRSAVVSHAGANPDPGRSGSLCPLPRPAIRRT